MIRNGIKLAYFYTSAIIGAGFVSGKEMLEYFASCGTDGFYGIILASFILAVTGTMTFILTLKYSSKNIQNFTNTLFGKILGNLVRFISFAFMLVISSAMTSGAESVLKEVFPIPGIKLIFLILCFICIIKNSEFICKINSLICPITIIGTIFISIYIISEIPAYYKIESSQKNWILSSLCWCSYNLITVPSVIFGIKESIKSKKSSLIGGFLSGIFIFAISFFTLLTISLFYGNILNEEVPYMHLCGKISSTLQYIYIIIFITAVFTTAVSLCNALSKEIMFSFNVTNKSSALVVCTLSFLLSFFGFGQTIKTLYAVFGYIGFFIPIAIFVHFIKNALS